MSHIQPVGEADFAAQVENASGVVVVDFMATWCPPCKALKPILERLAQRYEGRARFFECDTDRFPQLSASFGVGKIPNVMIWRDGQIIDNHVGFISEKQLSDSLDKITA